MTSYCFKVTSSECHFVKVLRTTVGYSLVTMVTKFEAPSYLNDLLPNTVNAASNYNLRNRLNFEIPFARLCSYENSFFFRRL